MISPQAGDGCFEPRTFVAAADDVLGRLDRFVVARFEQGGAPVSRSAVQRWIEAQRVRIDGAAARAADRVRAGARVEVLPMPPETTPIVPDSSVAFDVLFEDEHLIVLDKPPGLVVHPARGHETGTLVHGLLARGSFDRLAWASAPTASAAPGATAAAAEETERVRPGIVHRLDKGTSGILVVAKDERTREGLKALFSRHDMERVYVAIVVGDAASRTYRTLHGRHPTHRLKFTTRLSAGKAAVTHVRAIERLAGGRVTRVDCTLETGRTHQIRVHLAECGGTPVLGDPLYGPAPRDPLLAALSTELGHQALHARVLGFVHPISGERLRFEREPPADFQAVLARLRQQG